MLKFCHLSIHQHCLIWSSHQVHAESQPFRIQNYMTTIPDPRIAKVPPANGPRRSQYNTWTKVRPCFVGFVLSCFIPTQGVSPIPSHLPIKMCPVKAKRCFRFCRKSATTRPQGAASSGAQWLGSTSKGPSVLEDVADFRIQLCIKFEFKPSPIPDKPCIQFDFKIP